MNTCRAAALACFGVALTACSPEFDWRQVQPPGSELQALLPCKPVHRARPLMLAGQPVEFVVDACEAGGVTWALAFADLRDPARVDRALAELKAAAARHIGAGAAQSGPVQVPGMTPQPASQRLHLRGRLPGGAEVQQEAALFARGTTIFQATALGARLAEEPLATFFESLRFER